MLLWHVNLTFKVMLFSMLIQFFQMNDLKDLVSLVCLGRHVLSFSSQSRPYFYIIKQRVSRFYINVNLARVSTLYRTGKQIDTYNPPNLYRKKYRLYRPCTSHIGQFRTILVGIGHTGQSRKKVFFFFFCNF